MKTLRKILNPRFTGLHGADPLHLETGTETEPPQADVETEPFTWDAIEDEHIPHYMPAPPRHAAPAAEADPEDVTRPHYPPAPPLAADYRGLPVFRGTLRATGLRGLGPRVAGRKLGPPVVVAAEQWDAPVVDAAQLDTGPWYETAMLRLHGGADWPCGWYQRGRTAAPRMGGLAQ